MKAKRKLTAREFLGTYEAIIGLLKPYDWDAQERLLRSCRIVLEPPWNERRPNPPTKWGRNRKA